MVIELSDGVRKPQRFNFVGGIAKFKPFVSISFFLSDNSFKKIVLALAIGARVSQTAISNLV